MASISLNNAIVRPTISEIQVVGIRIDTSVNPDTFNVKFDELHCDLVIGEKTATLTLTKAQLPGVTLANLASTLPTIIADHVNSNGDII